MILPASNQRRGKGEDFGKEEGRGSLGLSSSLMEQGENPAARMVVGEKEETQRSMKSFWAHAVGIATALA